MPLAREVTKLCAIAGLPTLYFPPVSPALPPRCPPPAFRTPPPSPGPRARPVGRPPARAPPLPPRHAALPPALLLPPTPLRAAPAIPIALATCARSDPLRHSAAHAAPHAAPVPEGSTCNGAIDRAIAGPMAPSGGWNLEPGVARVAAVTCVRLGASRPRRALPVAAPLHAPRGPHGQLRPHRGSPRLPAGEPAWAGSAAVVADGALRQPLGQPARRPRCPPPRGPA